jgi:selenide, water dikinase
VISTAIKRGKAEPAWIDAAIQSMTTLNKKTAELIVGHNHNAHGFNSQGFEVHGMTDVTGFGLIGHARELALASNVSLEIFSDKLEALPGALESIRAGYIPGGLNANRDFAECVVGYEAEISPDLKALLFDPQTAGGLLISISETTCEKFISQARNLGIPARRIGNVSASQKPLIRIY